MLGRSGESTTWAFMLPGSSEQPGSDRGVHLHRVPCYTLWNGLRCESILVQSRQRI